ncbi:MAG: type IV toxin-antitoxin system AbiEi family antitoxin domain-containing protein [Rhodoglobus sp.]
MTLDRRLRDLGGIARTSELLALGYDRRRIEGAVAYGRLIRVRKGWYAERDLPDDVLEAVRIGGRLACVSALTHHGILPGGDGALHVEVPANASRLRLPDREVVLHWSGVAAEGTRLAVGVAAALAQSAWCSRGRRPDLTR